MLLGLLLAAVSAASASASACRTYLDYGRLSPMIGHAAPYAAVFDAHGIPVVRYSFGTYRNPATVGEWGLQQYSYFCLGKGRGHLAQARRAANWLAAHQLRGGGWAYRFVFHEGPVLLSPPWISALAQGRALSLLSRVYAVTPDPKYLRAARLALGPFARNYAHGGVASSWMGRPWYEEYPAANANHVLNGYEIALIGLHDVAARSPRARTLFTAGVRSLIANIAVFDGGPTGSYYAAGHFFPVPEGYLRAHVQLTRVLYRITRRPILRFYADRWANRL
jgi:heparosan-N-sulfate-glucuronate 5-epimerase